MEPGAIAELPQVDDFDSIAAIYRPRIFRFALASLRDRDAAESVAQDCLLKAYRSWHLFRGDCHVQTWLLQIAINLIRDLARSRRLQFWRHAQASAVDPADISEWIPDRHLSPEAHAAAKQQVEAIWKVIDKLSGHQRTCFLLRFMEDLNPEEIEAATGISRAAVKVHLFRAVHAVREQLGKSK